MTARAHVFGDHVNTDYIIAAQHKAASTDVREMAVHTFADIDPDFATRVRPGDVVVAGRNFGCGSSRETAVRVLQALGVEAVLARSFARIYFRNALNMGLSVFECDTGGIAAGDRVELDLENALVRNLDRGTTTDLAPQPPLVRALLDAGGIAAYLRLHGDLVLPPDMNEIPATDTHRSNP